VRVRVEMDGLGGRVGVGEWRMMRGWWTRLVLGIEIYRTVLTMEVGQREVCEVCLPPSPLPLSFPSLPIFFRPRKASRNKKKV
jgi:hypothetical protein